MSLTPHSTHWQRLTDIVNDCLEQPHAERGAFAAARCAGDPALLEEVLQWVRDAEKTQGFLDQPLITDASLLDSPSASSKSGAAPARDWVGQRLGAYRITSEIARGGMGSVYKAVRDDDAYQKVVAIKLIRSHLAHDVIALRFMGERQILANLDHPNIAHLIDGGQGDDGTPYLVMEYVDGLSIDLHCERQRLPMTERLKLFRSVCMAVHYAHQRLIVHRDLKPSNILVDANGQVKLLDFGIARLLDPSTLDASGRAEAAPTVANAMTPAYASPEQIKGEAVTTASDVYALGVLLYRLLTGQSPYKSDQTKPLDLAREIVDTDPERPSTVVTRAQSPRPTEVSLDLEKIVRTIDAKRLQRELRGDLDNIVLMALRKEPARRYASAEQLADDVSRYLDDLPIRAHADTWTYRTQKFLSRNRWSSAFAVLAGVALIGGIVATSYQAKVARDAQLRAETLFADVRKLANSYLFEVHDAVRDLPGATPVREMLVKNSVAYLDRLSRDAGQDPTLMAEIASGYDRLGDVQGAWRTASLGDTKGAETSFRKAIELRGRAAALFVQKADTKAEIETQRLLIVNHGKLAELLIASGRFDEGMRESRTALALSEPLAARENATAADKLNVARGRFSIASQQISNGDFASSWAELARSVEETKSLERAFPSDPLVKRVGAAIFYQAGALYLQNERTAEAKNAFVEALRVTELNLQREPGKPQFERMRNFVQLQLAETRLKIGEQSVSSAQLIQQQALDSAITLSAADPKNQRFAMDVPLMRQWVADKLARGGDFAGAITALEQSEREFGALTWSSGDALLAANVSAVGEQQIALVARAILEASQSSSDPKRCQRLTQLAAALKSAKREIKSESNYLLIAPTALREQVGEATKRCTAK